MTAKPKPTAFAELRPRPTPASRCGTKPKPTRCAPFQFLARLTAGLGRMAAVLYLWWRATSRGGAIT
jgi:hypothetical protein